MRVTDTVTDIAADAQASAAPHLILVDGSGYIFRAFHALPPMTRADGVPVNAVFGFTNMLAKLLRDHVGTHFAVIFDAGRDTFRNRISADYKAHRPPPPDELIPQFALVRDATAAFGVPAIELADWEADDLIASYCREVVSLGGRATIVSSDKDLMQLIGPGVDMLDPIKNRAIGPAEVMEKFGVPPAKLIEAQALMGDSVDNVPGVPGIGPKNAAQLITEFGDLEGVLAAAPAMKPSRRRDMLIEHAEAARISRRLVELRQDAPLPRPVIELGAREPDRATLSDWLHAMGFRSIATRLGYEPGAAPEDSVPVARAKEDVAFGPYETVTTLDALRAWAAEAACVGVVAIEAQADGPDPMRAHLVGLSLAVGPGRACYVPLRHEELGPQTALSDVAEALGPVLADASVQKVFHDAKRAMMLLGGIADGDAPAERGVIAPNDDVMLMSYALEAGAHGHELDELARLHLAIDPPSLDATTGTGRQRVTFAQVPIERAAQFAATRADATWRLWDALRPRLRTGGGLALYERIERRLTPVLLAMERAGVRVDADDLRRMSADFELRMAAIEAEIHRMAGRAFNLGSPKALGEVLFDEMGLPGGRRMKTGAYGTDASVLQALADQGHDLPARIMDWRQLSKLKSTYADALVGEINPATGRVHTRFAMAVASTGRLSSTEPNLQNIPIRTEEGSRIRRAFIAEPGHMLVSCDYSQIELRLLAHVADIPVLRDSFSRGEDIHARTASEVFGVPMEHMDTATRRRAKAINFGIIYGISAFGLARQLSIPAGEARGYIDAYFLRYPGIRAYMEASKEAARIAGYVVTPFGRRCWIPGIADKNPAKRAYAERQAANAPLQGGAADIIKRAMVRLPAALAEAGLRARLLLQVHDELLFEAPEHEAERLAALAKRVMEAAAALSVPLVVETGAGRTWAQAH